MKERLWTLACCILSYGLLVAQAEKPKTQLTTAEAVEFAETIEIDDLKKHLSKLSSDEFEGRETGTEGQRKAAQYIADYFESLGLPKKGDDNSYFQRIAFINESWRNISMSVEGENLKHLWDYYAYPSTNASMEEKTINELIFLGYGIDDENYSDYKKRDVAGKAILIYTGEPMDKKGRSRLTKSEELSEWTTNWRKKLMVARQKGVSHVFVIDRNFKENVALARREILSRALQFGEGEKAEQNYVANTHISSNVVEQIIGSNKDAFIKVRDKMEKKGKLKPLTIPCNLTIVGEKRVRSLVGENVLGYVEGVDPDLKEELVVVTAHYDHLGKRGDDVYNGADDNGSGSSSILELAEAFAMAKKSGKGPRRSVLALLVSGEEKGLLGSEYYVEHPVFPLDNTIANVNVDMVGRVDEKHTADPNYIYVIGSNRLSTELHDINEQANNEHTQLELDYTYNAESDPNRYYYRSDHYNFAEKGIPAIFYFNGTHEDYHRTSDTIEKINFEKMQKIAKLVFYTTWELANRDKRIEVDVVGGK